MTSLRNAFIAGVSALGIVAAAAPAEAASTTIAGIKTSDIQTVGWHGGGGRSWGGGGRSFGGGWNGGNRFSNRGWGGGRNWGGPRYGYYRGYRGHRGGNWGGYAAAGVLGLAAGAAIASPYYGGYGYGDDYYDGGYGYRSYGYARPYYGYSRAYYGGAECQVISRRYDRYGNPVRVVRYRPC